MKILDMKVCWYENFDNDPQLQILVDKMPDFDDLLYEKKDGLYFAEKDGYVSFFVYTKPGEGFGGRVFPITLTDGTKVDLKGPWSSRAGVMNKAGFEPCLDVHLTDDPEVWKRGYTFYAAHVTKKLVDEYLDKFLPDVFLYKQEDKRDGDIIYLPYLKDGRKKPNPQTYWGKRRNLWREVE
ncbi:MAG TPA: hypothetical protein P5293_06605 [Bacteroidales bacterium]|nr:hypothetical protein [Bacteroidales bacterium]